MDKRILKTKLLILETFIDLVDKNPDRKITVTELTEKANIARKTFYLHYSYVDDIIISYLNDFSSFFYSAARNNIEKSDDKETILILLMEDFLNNVKEHRKFLTAIVKSQVYYEHLNLFAFKILKDSSFVFLNKFYKFNAEKFDLIIKYHSAGIAKIITEYIDSDFTDYNKKSVETLASIILPSLEKVLEPI